NHLETARVRRTDLRNDFGRNDNRGKIDPVHLGLSREGTRNVIRRNNAITDQDIDDTGSAIKFRARLSDLLARNQPDLFEHFQHIIVVSLQGELIPVVLFKRTNLALWCQRATRFIRSALADFAEQILEDKTLILLSNGTRSWRTRQWLWL